MARKAPQEPTKDFHPSDRLQDNKSLNSCSLGCHRCPDNKICGGLHVEARILDCESLCTCANPKKCDTVCRKKPQEFSDRYREVNGFDLNTIPRALKLSSPKLPDFIPLIDHKYRRKFNLAEEFVAVPLYSIFDMRTGTPLCRTRHELSERFKISETATVIASGVDRDISLEAWWAFENRHLAAKALSNLGIALVTTPNFSLFTNVPRTDNLHSIKRIGLCWYEFMDSGVPAALHLNARTEADYNRWTAFISERPEVEFVSFEFGTGGGNKNRIGWHVEQLCLLARIVGRPLKLIVRGGTHIIHRLRESFAYVILIDTEPFSRTIHRQRCVIKDGRLKRVRNKTPKGAPIDDLLQDNINTTRQARCLPNSNTKAETSQRAAIRRRTTDTNGEARQASFLGQLDGAAKTGTMTTNSEGVIITPKA